ncbi:hypothetical protein QL285_038083 [Trifolium repens]|nr:hypothetical protein QL285_038083 [Trifolium repens]
MVRQDSLLLKLTTTFVHRDVLKPIEENPACAYSHLAFLKKLHNPRTDEETLGKVIQLSSVVDQYAKAVQKRIDNDTRLATQQQAQAVFFEKAHKAQAEVEKLSSQLIEGSAELKECDDNIAHYKDQIKLLEEQIVSYRRKIIEEETKRGRIEKELKLRPKSKLMHMAEKGFRLLAQQRLLVKKSNPWRVRTLWLRKSWLPSRRSMLIAPKIYNLS